jgi:hypothetical protein
VLVRLRAPASVRRCDLGFARLPVSWRRVLEKGDDSHRLSAIRAQQWQALVDAHQQQRPTASCILARAEHSIAYEHVVVDVAVQGAATPIRPYSTHFKTIKQANLHPCPTGK